MNTPDRPERTETYRSFVMDSSRWDGYQPRDGDIIICTPPKCGTTWMQMICALLVFQKTEFDQPLSYYTPWLDMLISPIDEVLEKLDGQVHRRFIKTHTPLDGLPFYENVSYVCVIRDPRDAFLSMGAHQRNINPEAMMKLMADTSRPALPPKSELLPSAPAQPVELSVGERFQTWIAASGKSGDPDDPLSSSVLRYAQLFWAHRDLPNIHMMHYSDLKADLGGEMRRLAKLLQIEVPASTWPQLIEAASFAHMKANADQFAPDAQTGMWQTNAGFFNKGQSGQWGDVLNDADLKVYRTQMEQRLEPELAAWVENGRLG